MIENNEKVLHKPLYSQDKGTGVFKMTDDIPI